MGVSVVAPPSLRFQGSLLLEDSLFYSIALLYQPLLDRHGTWLIGYRSREAIQFSRYTHVTEKNKKVDTRPSSYSWESCIHLLCHVCRSSGCPNVSGISVSWESPRCRAFALFIQLCLFFNILIIPYSNICVNSEIQNIVFIFDYFLLQPQYVVLCGYARSPLRCSHYTPPQ